MGREIRRVPPNWVHPRHDAETASREAQVGNFRPMFDEDFETAAEEWLENCLLWSKGKHPDQQSKDRIEYKYYWQWSGNPPDEDYYRPKWSPEEATHYQVYETVSEGTPVTPPFAAKELLIEYLVQHGDFWDQKRGYGPGRPMSDPMPRRLNSSHFHLYGEDAKTFRLPYKSTDNSFGEKKQLHYVKYTPQLWAGLNEVASKIEELAGRLNDLLGSEKGLLLVEGIVDKLLPAPKP